MLQILGPALAVGAVLVLLGALIALNDRPPAAASSASGAPASPEAVAASQASLNPEEGMSKEVPPADAKEWKPIEKGVKIWDVKEGDGPEAKPGKRIRMHYTGWYPTGVVFDSSLKRGEPFSTDLTDVIQGWTVGVAGMKPGGVRRLYIPAALAYGDGAGGRPAGDLIFEVKYVSAN